MKCRSFDLIGSFSIFLRWISLGKYRPKLYYKGRSFYASFCGGCLTLLMFIMVAVFSTFILYETFTKEFHYIEH